MATELWGEEWDRVVDVVVVGSGVAGCSAALAAAQAGSEVALLEEAAFIGGTTAKSGGVMWVCDNPVMRRDGVEDNREDALKYLARTAYPVLYRADHPTLGLPADRYRLLEVFYDEGGSILEELERQDILPLEHVPYPDYHADIPEDKTPLGRCVQPVLPPDLRSTDPTGGQFLVDYLIQAAEKLGAVTLLGHRVAHVVKSDAGKVIGVEVHVGRRTELIGARQGVVFGSGGFLHNERHAQAYLKGPVLGGAALHTATGDFVDIGIEVGAELGNMSHAWWDQVIVEFAVRNRATSHDIYSPFGDAMIMVNRYGRRVVNEKAVYNERGQAHLVWDPSRREYSNYLLFMIFDESVVQSTDQSRFRWPIPKPAQELPSFALSGKSWPELVDEITKSLQKLGTGIGGVTLDSGFEAELASTIERWNLMADAGLDEDFARGETPIEQAWAGAPRDGAVSGSMHSLSSEGPYHCIILGPGALDTKGGPVTDEHGRVMTPGGEPIAGLYGAGNCVASPAAQAYWGPGGTIGPALVFGFVAGRHCSATNR